MFVPEPYSIFFYAEGKSFLIGYSLISCDFSTFVKHFSDFFAILRLNFLFSRIFYRICIDCVEFGVCVNDAGQNLATPCSVVYYCTYVPYILSTYEAINLSYEAINREHV